jgi:hypothetical protein
VGPGRGDGRDQPPRRRDRAQGRRRAALRGGLGRADRLPAGVRRPDARRHLLPHARRRVHRAVPRPRRGWRRRHPDRDRAGHPRGQGGDLRRPRGDEAGRSRGADTDAGLLAAQRRQDAARDRHLRRPGDARGARRRRDRAELLDRPGGHARRDPLPRRVLAGARVVHPQRRHPDPGPGRPDDLPRAGRAVHLDADRLRRALRHQHRRRLLRHDARPHPRARRERPRPPRQGAAGPALAARQLDDRRDAARAGAAPHDGRRAGELAGLAQGQGAAARRRLRGPQPDRRGPGRGRRARARPLRGAHRARGRGRADAPRRRARFALPARADPGRLHGTGRHRGRARADPRPGDRQLDQPRGGTRQARPRRADRAGARRVPHRADDRRGRDGQDGRAQARDRAARRRRRRWRRSR